MFNLKAFIDNHVTKRPYSMFAEDIQLHMGELQNAVEGKSVLVIGGAGSIGSSFIR